MSQEQQLYHKILSIPQEKWASIKKHISHHHLPIAHSTVDAARYIERVGSQDFIDQLQASGIHKIKDIIKKRTGGGFNDYKHEFLKEISAQMSGFKPSLMWGPLTSAKIIHHPEDYLNIMRHDHALPTKALEHVIKIGKEVKKSMSKSKTIHLSLL